MSDFFFTLSKQDTRYTIHWEGEGCTWKLIRGKKYKFSLDILDSKTFNPYKSIDSKECYLLVNMTTHMNISSVQFSGSVVSDSLWPHEPQHARPPCPSPTPGIHPNPCPLSRWCHPTILSSVVPFSSCPQSFPASGSSQMSQLFTSGGQSIGVSALCMHTYKIAMSTLE